MSAVRPPVSDRPAGPIDHANERAIESAETRWQRMPVIETGEQYIDSLKGRGTRLFLFGELIEEPADHPIIRLSGPASTHCAPPTIWPSTIRSWPPPTRR